MITQNPDDTREGKWEEPYEYRGKIWLLKCGPVFSGEITFGFYEGRDRYRPTLNGELMGYYPDLDNAKACIEWEIWNRIRQMLPGYNVLLKRWQSWQYGGNGKPPAKWSRLG